MFRRSRRWGRFAVVLIGLHLAAGMAAAADTREMYIGSGPAGDPDTAGILVFTPVTAGGVSAGDVVVRNLDNQTLTHVVLAFEPLPSGFTFAGVYGRNADACTMTDTSLSCDFGNLAKRAERSITVVLAASTATTGATVTATVQFNESTTQNGANAHVGSASGTVVVGEPSCDLTLTFLPPGQLAKTVGTDGCDLSTTNPQSTQLTLPASVVAAIRVAEVTSTACAADVTCFGQLSVGDVSVDGTYPVTWVIQWQVPSNFNVNQFGVVHFADDGSVDFVLANKSKSVCKTATATGCFVTAPSKDGTVLSAIIRTSGNGGMRGFG